MTAKQLSTDVVAIICEREWTTLEFTSVSNGALRPASHFKISPDMGTATKTHSIPFHDHDGHASAMVFWAPTNQPLPPLYSFAIYVTSPGNSSESIRAVELLQALNMSRYAPEATGYRLDIYFRPGASVEECERHYDAERTARGTYADQLKEIRDGRDRRGADNARQITQRLPGLVPSYLRPPSFCHHDMLFVIDGPAGRRCGADVRMVEFRPASVPEEFDPDPEELEEAPDIVAPTRVRAFPVFPDPEAYDGAGTVQGKMYEAFLIKEQELSGPYERALELGWTSW